MTSHIKLSSPATREFWEIPVLYEDEHLLALDKPGGLLTSAVPDQPEHLSLIQLLHAGIAENKPWAKERGLSFLLNAHGLDAEASGVILLAKSKPALGKLLDFFGVERPSRRYVALAQGERPESLFEVKAKLAPHPTIPGQMRIDSKDGKRSLTAFETLEQFSRYTLLKCVPLTDRPHQIRVHLRHARMPVVGDQSYGGRRLLLSRLKPNYRLKGKAVERPLIDRAALHAEQLDLVPPVSAQPVTIVAPWPKDLTVAVKYLRKYAQR